MDTKISATTASTMQIAMSGMRAQTSSMKVIANNIANAMTSRTAAGTPYQRQQVVTAAGRGLGGVESSSVVRDTSSFKDVYLPGHPDANPAGYVKMPNVDLPVEMMSMVTASRMYQANAAVMKRHMDGLELTLELLK
ncbi:MAG: flagellar basal body rod protein FlgC [Phycisphaerae bacterium]|nr:flagellar basal body rod protein FlgC [Phycisphaerae bacterium]